MGPPGTFSPDCLESPTLETYASGGSLSSSVVLCRPDMEPLSLLQCMKVKSESEEGKVILKDRFLTQSAPDIRRKLLKQAYGP